MADTQDSKSCILNGVRVQIPLPPPEFKKKGMKMGKRKKFVGVQFVETVRDGDITYAFGVYSDAKLGRIPFAGSSRKNETDHENTTRGRNFAVGRAFEKLGKEIQKKEWAALKTHPRKNGVKKVYTEEEIAELRKAAKDAKVVSKPKNKKTIKVFKDGTE